MGDGDFIVLNLEHKKQSDIITPAHQSKIVSIVSLSKLSHKYFITRCLMGDLGIWSSSGHPDRVFLIESNGKEEAHRDTMIEINWNDTRKLN